MSVDFRIRTSALIRAEDIEYGFVLVVGRFSNSVVFAIWYLLIQEYSFLGREILLLLLLEIVVSYIGRTQEGQFFIFVLFLLHLQLL